MRLIEANELMAKVNEIKYLRKRKAQMLVDECNEVEAIPVEWLLNSIPKDSVMWEYNRKLIEYLVIGWKEENETNRR